VLETFLFRVTEHSSVYWEEIGRILGGKLLFAFRGPLFLLMLVVEVFT